MYRVLFLFLLICSRDFGKASDCVEIDQKEDIKMIYKSIKNSYASGFSPELCEMCIEGKRKSFLFYPIKLHTAEIYCGVYLPVQLYPQFSPIINGAIVDRNADLNILGEWVANISFFDAGNNILFAPRLISKGDADLVIYFGIRKQTKEVGV